MSKQKSIFHFNFTFQIFLTNRYFKICYFSRAKLLFRSTRNLILSQKKCILHNISSPITFRKIITVHLLVPDICVVVIALLDDTDVRKDKQTDNETNRHYFKVVQMVERRRNIYYYKNCFNLRTFFFSFFLQKSSTILPLSYSYRVEVKMRWRMKREDVKTNNIFKFTHFEMK